MWEGTDQTTERALDLPRSIVQTLVVIAIDCRNDGVAHDVLEDQRTFKQAAVARVSQGSTGTD